MNILPVSIANVIDIYELPQNAVQAQKVEKTTWFEVPAQAAYYTDGVIYTLNSGRQLIYTNGLLMGSSDFWTIENLHGNNYIKHSYDGVDIYTSDSTQFYIYK